MAPTIDPKFRVIRIADSLRDEIKQARDARGTTNAALVEAAVNGNLEDLTTALRALGFDADDAPKRPARYQISDELQAELRQASESVNVPATQLLTICLKRETAKPAAARARGGRRRRRIGEGDAVPRKRRRRKSAGA
jgi:hypothetical protein